MRTKAAGVRGSPREAPAVGGVEVLDVAIGRVERVPDDEFADHGPAGVVLRLDESGPEGNAPGPRSTTNQSAWRTWAVVASVITAAGSLISHSTAGVDPPVPIAVGQVSVSGPVERVGPDSAELPVSVSIHSGWSEPVEVVSVQPVGWSVSTNDGPGARHRPAAQVTLPPGQWVQYPATVRLHCRETGPVAATWVEALVRTPTGEYTHKVQLPKPAWGMAAAWRQLCPQPDRLGKTPGLYM